ncbi:hypothetical protein BGW41_005777 [Actinomortierella wolfii]|nr:hypothetical protein BGW41_005777 [Actinomortierella wolfii]
MTTMNKLTSSSKPRRLATSTATDSLERMPTVTTKSTPTVSSAEAKEAPMTTNLTPAPRMNKGSDKGRVAAAPTIAAVSSSTTLPPAGGSIRSQSETTTGFEIETLIDLNSSTVPDLQRLDKAITNAHTETGGSNNGSVGSTNCISSTSSDMKPSISPEGSYPALRSQQQQKEPHHQPYQLRQRWPDKSHISSGAEHTNGHPTAKGAPAAPPGKEHEYSMLDHFSSNDIPFSPAITSAAPKAAAQGSCAQGPHSEPLTPLHQSTPSPMMLHQSLQYRPLPPKLPQHRHQQKAPQPVAATNLSGMDLNLTNPVDGRTKDSQHCQQQESRLSGSNDINHWDQPPLDRGQPIDFPSFTPTLSRAASAVAGEHGKKEGTVFSFSSLSRDLADVGDQDVDDVDAAVPYFVNVQPDKRSPAAAVVPDVEPVSQEADEWFRDDKASMTNITLAATASESAVAVPAVRREVVTETNVDQEQKESSLISPPPPVISNSTATATSPSDLTKNIITNDNTMPSIAKTTATTNDPRSDNADEAATIHKVSEPVKKTKSDHHHHDQQQQQQPQQADQQLSRGDDLDHQQNQEDSSSPPVIGYPPPPPAILYSDDKITVSSLHLTIHSFYLPMHQPLTIELRTIQSIVTVAEQGGSSSTGSALSWQNYYQTRGLALPEKINLWPLLGVSPGGSISLGGGGGGNGIGISGNSSLSSLGSLGSQFLLATKKRATSGGHPILSHSSTQFQPPPGASPSTSQAPPHLQVIIQVAGDRFRKGFAVQHARGVEILKRAWRHVKESEQGLRPLHPARGLSFDDLDDGEKDENADEDDFDEMSSSFDEGSAVEDEDFEEDDELYGNLPEPGSIGGGGTKKRQKKNSEKKNQSPSKDKVEADFDPDDDDDVDDYDAIHDYPFGINIGHHKHLRPTGGRHSHGKRGGAKSLSQTKSSSSSAGMDYHNSWHSYPFADFFTPPPPPPHQRLYRPVSKSSKTAASEAGGGGGPGTTTEDGVACGDAPLFVDNDLNIHDKI